MKKKMFVLFWTLTLIMSHTSFAQDLYKTAAEVPMIQLNNEEMVAMRSLNKEERFFNMPLEDKGRVYLNIQMKD